MSVCFCLPMMKCLGTAVSSKKDGDTEKGTKPGKGKRPGP